MRKRLLALGLVLVMCMSMATPAFAQEADTIAESEYTFIDSDGKENTLILNAYEDGKIITNYYIEGVWHSKTEGSYDASTESVNLVRQTAARSIERMEVPLEDIVSTQLVRDAENVQTNINVDNTVSVQATNSYTYEGRIYYNPAYNLGTGGYDYYNLAIYTSFNREDYDYQTFNALAGYTVDALVTLLASALTVFYPPLTAAASGLFGAMAISLGATITSGILKSGFVGRYYVHETFYDVKAIDNELSRTQYFQGSKYRVLLPGNEWTSDDYRRSFYWWYDDGIATVLYENFWAVGSCPGVDYYYKA